MNRSHRPPLAQLLTAALLIVALAWFIYRTTPRSGAAGGLWLWDYAVISEASRAWLDGRNPYDEPALRQRWRENPADGLVASIDHLESLLPPPTLAANAPLALLPRAAALKAWYTIEWALLIATIAAMWSIARLAPSEPRAILLAAGVFLLGPVQSSVQAGQLALPAVACIVFALRLDLGGRAIAAGMLLAAAMALKLQIAGPFILYFLVVHRWKTALTAACLFAGITLVAVVRLEVAGVPWLEAWLANIRRSTGPGGPNDFATGVAMDHLLNLHLPLYAITHSRPAARLGALLIVILAAIVYALRLRRAKACEASDPLLLIAPAAVLTLLPVYHRYYDATLLVIPLAWAIAVLSDPARRRWGIGVLLLMAPFVLPVGWATNLLNRGYLPPGFAAQSWWRILIMPLQVWALVALAVVLIAALPRRLQKN